MILKTKYFRVMTGFALIGFLVFSLPSYSGCRINLFVKNTGKVTNGLTLNKESAVRSKGGAWRKLSKGGWYSKTFRLKPGEKKGKVYKAAFGCKLQRQYRIRYVCTTGQYKHSAFTAYYPSASGWTRKTDITINLPKCK